MSQLLGFAVLTGPLFLIVPWAIVCLVLAVLVGRNLARKSLLKGIVSGLAFIAVVMPLPIADEIAGRIYLNHLCETQAGAKVYQTIELPAEYWDEDEKPLFMNSRGVLDMKMLGDRFEWKQQKTPFINNILKIDKFQWILYDKKTEKALGKKNSFSRKFGWINNFSPAPNTGEGCRTVLAKKYDDGDFEAFEIAKNKEFVLQIFSPSTK